MKTSKFTEEQVAYALRLAGSGIPMAAGVRPLVLRLSEGLGRSFDMKPSQYRKFAAFVGSGHKQVAILD
jgi:hypothetical protein